MAKLIWICITLFAIPYITAFSFAPEDPTDRKILVLVDDFAVKSSHSLYFKALRSRGLDLEFKLAEDPKLALQRHGHYQYDGLILFCPHVQRFGGSIDVAAILDFVDTGHDLIIASDVDASEAIRDVATGCGVDFDEDPSAMVIDHINYAVSDMEQDHTLIAGDDFLRADVITGHKKINAPVLFHGVAHSLNPANTLGVKILSASPSAYSSNPKSMLSSPPSLTGSAISLVSVVQARNNARVLITGSMKMFCDRFFRSEVQKAGGSTKYEKSGNEKFVTEVTMWVFHERGELKVVNMKHHKAGGAVEPSLYRIKDDLEFSVEIYEWTGKIWKPYVASDVQVQFYMMSPYVLKTMSTNKKGLYSTSLKVPDVYGVFQFKVEYERLGYTTLSLSKQIPVRPYRHNEFERYIVAAYPYYGGEFTMMAGFFVFTVVYLYNK